MFDFFCSGGCSHANGSEVFPRTLSDLALVVLMRGAFLSDGDEAHVFQFGFAICAVGLH